MTPDEMQAAIEANTTAISQLSSAVDVLVTRFIRPTAQQTVANIERLERIEELLDRHAQAIVEVDFRLDRMVEQIAANAQQIAANTEAITDLTDSLRAFDLRLEETRTLVAGNGSQIAVLRVVIAENGSQIDALRATVAENVAEGQAMREAMQTQLSAIIGNARRIDRLEQRAS